MIDLTFVPGKGVRELNDKITTLLNTYGLNNPQGISAATCSYLGSDIRRLRAFKKWLEAHDGGTP